MCSFFLSEVKKRAGTSTTGITHIPSKTNSSKKRGTRSKRSVKLVNCNDDILSDSTDTELELLVPYRSPKFKEAQKKHQEKQGAEVSSASRKSVTIANLISSVTSHRKGAPATAPQKLSPVTTPQKILHVSTPQKTSPVATHKRINTKKVLQNRKTRSPLKTVGRHSLSGAGSPIKCTSVKSPLPLPRRPSLVSPSRTSPRGLLGRKLICTRSVVKSDVRLFEKTVKQEKVVSKLVRCDKKLSAENTNGRKRKAKVINRKCSIDLVKSLTKNSEIPFVKVKRVKISFTKSKMLQKLNPQYPGQMCLHTVQMTMM